MFTQVYGALMVWDDSTFGLRISCLLPILSWLIGLFSITVNSLTRKVHPCQTGVQVQDLIYSLTYDSCGPRWRLRSYSSQASEGYKLKAECLFLICLELLFSLYCNFWHIFRSLVLFRDSLLPCPEWAWNPGGKREGPELFAGAC